MSRENDIYDTQVCTARDGKSLARLVTAAVESYQADGLRCEVQFQASQYELAVLIIARQR